MFPLYDLNPHRRVPLVTVLIILANVAVTLWMTSLGPDGANDVAVRYGFVPKRVSELGSGKPIVVTIPRVNRLGEPRPGVPPLVIKLPDDSTAIYATLLTTMFLHGGWFHVLSNMWILWIFGNNIEDRLGHFMYACYYLVGGLIATLCHWATDTQSAMPMVGASGAVAVVLGGYAITYPWAKVRTLVFVGLIMIVDIPALVWLGIWFVVQNVIPGLMVLGGVLRDPVAYWAHIGGFVAGIALMPILSLGASPPETDWRKEADAMFHFEDPRAQ